MATRKQVQRRGRLGLVLGTVLAALACSAVALADNTQADGDGVAPLGDNDMAFGAIACATPTTKNAPVVIRRNGAAGSTNVFKDGSTVAVTIQSVTGSGLAAAMSASNTITLPANWGAQANNTLSADVTSMVTVNSSTPGAGSGVVTYVATGVRADGSTLTRTDTMNVSWTTGSCAPADGTAPAGSVSIDGGAAYANSTSVSLDLAATDAVGVTAYRVANGSDCSAATSVSVSSTTSFSQTVSHTLLSGEGSKTVCAQFRDAAGNWSATATDTIVVDTIAPAIQDAGVQTGTAGSNGWYVSAVTNRFTASDGGSGLDASCSSGFPKDVSTGSSEGTGIIVASGSCSDLAGNTNSGIGSATFKIDLTDPSAVLTITAGLPGANGWRTTDVTVTTTGIENVSGPLNCTADQFQTAETTGAVFDGSCTNQAGRSASAAPLTVKLDKTGPSATLSVTTGTLGANGWYTSDVTVATSGSDTISAPVGCTGNQSQSTETAGQSFTGTCTNDAGLSTDAAPLTVKLDKSAPSAALAVTGGTAGANGWYTSNVTVGTSGADSISGPVSCSPNQFQNTETPGATFNGSCTNQAGLVGSAAPLTVKLDKTGPSATMSASGTSGANGWFTSDVTVATDGTDSISSPVVCTPDRIQSDETVGETFNGSCTNDAGLATNAAPLTVKVDKTGPTAALAVTGGTLGSNGWYTSNVTVATGGADTISGPVVCTATQSQTTETTGQVFNGSCTNNAGLQTNAAPLTIKLDKTGPTAALAATGMAGANGWFIGDVTIATGGADSISGPVVCTADQSQTTETTGQVFDGSCTNDAGLLTNAASLTVKLDKTNPSVAITSPAGGSTTIASAVTVSGTDSDATSGIASVKINGNAATLAPGTFSRAGVGLACGGNTINALATDQAGRTSTDSITVTRQCFGIQFLQPIDQSTSAPIMNKGKYGRVIPVKVLLSLAGGTSLDGAALVANGWTLQLGVNGANCSSGAGADEIEAYADAGQSAAGSNLFRWDATPAQWVYNLDTRAPAGVSMSIGNCYRLDVYVSDGVNKVIVSTSVYALFQPTK